MAQRTVTTRLSAARATRDRLEQEISDLRSGIQDMNARSSPAVTKTATPSGVPPDSQPVVPHDLTQLLQQQQQLMTMLTHIVSTSTDRRQPNDRPPDHDAPPRAWKVDIPVLTSPDDTDLTAFADWKLRWFDYLSLTRARENIPTVAARQGLLRSALHSEWTILWQTGRLDVHTDDDIDHIVVQLERYLRRRRNPLLDRKDFFGRMQGEGETVDHYVAALIRIHDRCAFEADTEGQCSQCGNACDHSGRLKDSRLRDQLICGLRDPSMQRRVLLEEFSASLTLTRVLQVCRAHESSLDTAQELSQETDSPQVMAMRRSTYKRTRTNPPAPSSQCDYCGDGVHPREQCKARKQICHNCNKRGHFASVCRQKTKPQAQPTSITHLYLRQATQAFDHLITVHTQTNPDTQGNIRWLPDSGADVDAITVKDLATLDSDLHRNLAPDRRAVHAANGARLHSLGTVAAVLTLQGHSCSTVLHVYQQLNVSLLSRATCIKLGLLEAGWPHTRVAQAAALSIEPQPSPGATPPGPPPASNCPIDTIKARLMAEFPSVFQDGPFRAMEGPPMHIDLRSDATPCRQYRARTIPFQWRDAVEQQLNTMVAKDVIERVPVGESITWCHPMVVVPKKGSAEPRITVDLTGLNKFVERPAYPTRVPCEVVASIPPGMRYFTTLDSRHGYWQIPLDEESSKLTTFLTPWGAYRFKRNVMGLISAGDEHNRRGDDALAGLDNVQKVVEDVIVYDTDQDAHIQRVRSVLRRCMTHGITLHPGKFVFAAPSVSYCGFKVSQSGYTVDDHLVSAISQFPVPLNRTDVRSFCGLVQQFQAFSPNLTALLAPIRTLLSPKSEFIWETPHQEAFEKVLHELASPRILANYAPNRPLRLETDAAQSRGLGMALWQQQPSGEWRLLQCGSRHITAAESRYSATEIELLAVVWAAQKAHLFLAGADFELIVDHRPLIPILNSKTLDELPSPRLIRLKEKLATYRFTTAWRPGVDHKVADCFSRHPVEDPTSSDHQADDDDATAFVQAALLNIQPVSADAKALPLFADPHLARLQAAANRDAQYKQLRTAVQHGPLARQHQATLPTAFAAIKHDLWVSDNLVMYGSRVVVPAQLRQEVLRELHTAHQGQDRTLRRARQAVYWPGITTDIRNMVRGCAACAERLPSQAPEPLQSDPLPSRPFESTAADLFHIAGRAFLVYTDRFSGWPDVGTTGRTASSTQVIRLLKEWMTNTGVPSHLKTDGGPQFSSHAFKEFCKCWGIQHVFSSPHHHESNGAAEAAVKAMKALLAKTTTKGNIHMDEFRRGVLEFRNTPRAHGFSPAQLLYGRTLRSTLPTHPSALQPQWQDLRKALDAASTELTAKAKRQHDLHAHPLSTLAPGTVVRVQHPRTKRWDTIAEVVERKGSRSYTIRTESGRVLWRNRRFLRLYFTP